MQIVVSVNIYLVIQLLLELVEKVLELAALCKKED